MDGFADFETATAEELPDAVAETDPFHEGARRTLSAGVDLLTDKQTQRIRNLFAVEIHGEAHAEI